MNTLTVDSVTQVDDRWREELLFLTSMPDPPIVVGLERLLKWSWLVFMSSWSTSTSSNLCKIVFLGLWRLAGAQAIPNTIMV